MLDTNEGRIRAIYILTNPDKLAHLRECPQLPDKRPVTKRILDGLPSV
jgi:hypothetical protein